VALKLLTGPAGGEAAARLVREARHAARVQHVGVARVHEVGEHEGQPYVAMDYVEGEPLATHLERARRSARSEVELPGGSQARGRLAPALESSVVFVEEAARALHAAHEAGLIHCDLKPANLMVTPDGRPVILDFGLSCEAGEGPGSQGTPAYMAPEQVEGGAERPDRRTDVFALGAVLFECVTLRRPFEGSGPHALGHSLLAGPAPRARRLRRGLPRALDTILGVALARAQDERYQTALDLAEDLRRLATGEPVLARRSSFFARARRNVQRRPFVSLGWAAIAAALAVGTALSLERYGRSCVALSETTRWIDRRVLAALEQEAQTGWPRLPAAVPEMDAWLEEAEALERRVAVEDPAAGAGEPSELSAGLQRLSTLATDLRQQREEASTLAARTIEDHRQRWEEAIATIADVVRCPRYGGLVIEPQVGLVPLGRDEYSRLYEFHHVQTGVAEPSHERGSWRVGLDTGLVLVLLPGGRLSMGAVPPGLDRPDGSPNVDPYARADEGPVHEVALDPFFLSKYEMLRAQWLRAGGVLAAGTSEPENLELPIDVSHAEAEEILARCGLLLPSEAQWEHAARGEHTSPWWWGQRLEQLDDKESMVATPRRVGTHAHNPFGLYDVLGNASELTRDWLGSYDLPARAGDGLRQVEDGRRRTVRGVTGTSGSPTPSPQNARCAARGTNPAGALRPARTLEGGWRAGGR
jgi:formylglycine-generating enzyme required for sulfatase activity